MFVQFAELPVFDRDRARRFYFDHFQCEVVADMPMAKDGWRWLELKFPGAETGLHFLRRPDEAPSWDLASNGVTIVTKPSPAPYNPQRTVAAIEDSENNRIVISSQ